MRMQLRKIIWLLVCLPFIHVGLAQTGDEQKSKYAIGEVDVDFMFSYYEQDGDHSAVQGGVGNQHLTDFVSGIVINVPLDTSYILNIKFSADAYTSASTNRIDDPVNPLSSFYKTDVVSSASYKDTRAYGNLNITKNIKNGNSINAGLGFSKEYDVSSMSYNLGWAGNSKNNNTSLEFSTSGIFDTWSLIYPVELRTMAQSDPSAFLQSNKRESYHGSLLLSQILSPRFQASIIYDVTYQTGLLSTPFHRVYFDDGYPLDDPFKAVDIERLPDNRLKQAIGVRANAFPANFFILRSFFRYYYDSFGVNAVTAELELPIKFNRFVSVYPFYRYSNQTESNYFKAFGVHVWDDIAGRGVDEYYTSDYDLSTFYSHKYGLGARISPAFGIAKSKEIPYLNRSLVFKSIDLRGGLYNRSDGLSSFFGAVNVSFVF